MLLLPAILAAAVTHSPAQEDFKHPRRPLEVKTVEVKARAEGRAPLGSQLRLRALGLAASTADEALGWGDKQAAVRSLSQAADLLWTEHPERSREWLEKAWELAGAVSDEEADRAAVRFRSTSARARARAAVLDVAQKHDRRLADRLIAQLGEGDEKSRGETRRGAFDDRTARSEQLLNMALAVAERDPLAASELGRRSLADGVSFQLQSLLLLLRARDRAAAERLFDSALERLSADFRHPSEGQVLASYLFTPGRVAGPGAGTMLLAVGANAPATAQTPAEADPARARRFLRVMQRVLLAQSAPAATEDPSRSAQEFVSLCGSLAGGYRLYAPELWAAVELRVAQALPHLAPAQRDSRMPAQAREKLASGRAAGADEKELNRLYVEGLAEAAEKESDPVARKFAFVRATLATRPQELEYARKLADRIDEAELRRQVLSLLAYRAALVRLDAGSYDEAVELAAEASPLHRAVILIAAARKVNEQRPTAGGVEESRNRRARARELLYTAGDLLAREGLPAYALRVRLGLVAALAPVDAERSFEVFSGAVGAINEDSSFDPDEGRLPRLTGLADYMESATPPAGDFFGLKDAVAPLARADLEATIMMTNRLSAPSVRGACLLEIARAILAADSAK